MQSFLQYRRFRATVKAQLDGAKDRLEKNKGILDRGRRDTNTTAVEEMEKGDASRHQSDDTLSPDHRMAGEKAEANRPIGTDASYHAQAPPGNHHDLEEAERRPSSSASRASTNDEEEPEDPDHDLRQYLSRRSSARSTGAQLSHAMTGIELRKRSTREGGDGKEQVFIVGYHGDDDPLNPHNWSTLKRIWITAVVAGIGFVVGVASSIDSIALPQAAKYYGVSEVAETLATGLYLIGFGAGAFFAGPISETVGRNPVYSVSLFLYMIFIMASGLAPNIGAQLVFRFLAGFFGSTPLTCAGGSLSDMWDPFERVYAFPIFANAAFLGPVLGPVMGGFISQDSSQLPAPMWRWCEWITLIMSGLVFAAVIFLMPETFPPILLKWKAAHMRELTGDSRYRAEVEVRSDPFFTRLGKALYRPFLLTATEPIIILIALYLTVIYIVLFTFLDGYTYIFEEIHGLSQGMTGLCFLGIAIGLFGATALVPLIGAQAKRELHRVKQRGGSNLAPEFRLWYSMYGSPAIPISLFWMGWTSSPDISIWSPLAASVLFGYGILCVFISSYQYIIDSYEIYAASALASVTLIRYVAAGGMTVVGLPFYQNLGVHYTLTILACISCVVAPVPYLFYVYGKTIRKRSKYAPTD